MTLLFLSLSFLAGWLVGATARDGRLHKEMLGYLDTIRDLRRDLAEERRGKDAGGDPADWWKK